LVLDARRVDTLRRQVLDRQRVQKHGRRTQVVLWALAGAGAVLLGGWLATRLSPASDRAQDALVLGRGESESLSPPAAPSEGSGPSTAGDNADEHPDPSASAERSGMRFAGAGRPSAAAAAAEPGAVEAHQGTPQTGEASAGERSPEDPKVVGDWGDGLDSAGRARSDGRVQRGPPPRPAPAGSDVFDLDELPTE
jgi:hypothetical protein